MKFLTTTLLAVALALPAHASTLGPIRAAKTDRVVGMLTVRTMGVRFHVRATASNIHRRRAITAWVFCWDDIGRLGPPARLDGDIGVHRLEGSVALEELCGDDNLAAAQALEVVIIDHGAPVDRLLDGVEGSVIQVTTNNNTDPFCTGEARPRRHCRVLASGVAPLP